MGENPYSAPQTKTAMRGIVSRLVRNPAFWFVLFALLMVVLAIGVPLFIDWAIDDWYRQRGLYVE
jgi:hypothetical protein